MSKYYLLTYILICTLGATGQANKTKSKITFGQKVHITDTNTCIGHQKTILKTFKYDNNEIKSGIGVSDEAYTIGAFIELPDSALNTSINKTIDIIRIGIDNKNIITNASLIIYEDSLKGTPALMQAVIIDSISKGWNMFALTNGYTIIENKTIFVGIIIETNSGGFTQTYDTDPATYPQYSGHTLLNGEYYGTLYSEIGIDADYNIQALITDGQGVDFSDLTIVDIQPTSNGCSFDSLEVLRVTIKNIGTDAYAGEFDLLVTVNNTEVNKQVTPTVIEPNAKITVNMPSINMQQFGIYNTLSSIELTDADTTNNTYYSTLLSGDANLKIELLTDDYPEDTHWELSDSDGNTIIASRPFVEPYTEYIYDLCIISTNCYVWEIFDAYGDGMSGNGTNIGTFKVYYNNSLIAQNPEDGNFGYKYRVSGIADGCIANNISITELNIPHYELPTDIYIKGTVYNKGTDTLNSFKVKYIIDDYTSPEILVSGISVANGESFDFTHTTPFNFTQEKTYNIHVNVMNPNNINDEDTTDNFLTHKIIINSDVLPKKQLIEHFNSSTNDACFNYTPELDAVLAENTDNYSLIRYQLDRPGAGDPYYISQSGNRADYYNLNIIPSVYRNGKYNMDYSQEVFDVYMQQKTIVELQIEASYYNFNVYIKVTISTIDSLEAGLTAHIAIIENTTTENTGSNGETEFYNVIMQMLPNSEGTILNSITPFNPVECYESFNMSNTFVEDMNDLSAVIFIQNSLTKEILQSTMVDIELAESIAQTKNSGYLIYPNPFNDIITIENLTGTSNIIISNALGQIVHSQHFTNKKAVINTGNIGRGIYFISIIDKNNKVSTIKLVK